MCSSGAGAKYALFFLYKNKSTEGQEKALFLKNIMTTLNRKEGKYSINIQHDIFVIIICMFRDKYLFIN